MMAEEPNDTDQIEQDLAQTRARMDRRLDELQDKMSPKQIVNDALAYVQGGDGADFTSSLISRAKANPWAAVVTGAGLAWLMTSSRQSPEAHRAARPYDDLHDRISFAESRVQRFDGEHDDAFNERLDAARGQALDIHRQQNEADAPYRMRIAEAVANVRLNIRETSHDAQAGASSMLANARRQAAHGAQSIHEGSQSMAQRTTTTITSLASNPLALGGIAAVVGLIAGSLIPTFEGEERAFGSTANKLRESGRGMAQDLADTGGRVVNQVLDTALESADREGLSPDKPIGETFAALKSGELVASVKQVAADALEAGKGAAHAEAAPAQPNHGTDQA
jgi:vacuolar-type H+-ATPase subunit H